MKINIIKSTISILLSIFSLSETAFGMDAELTRMLEEQRACLEQLRQQSAILRQQMQNLDLGAGLQNDPFMYPQAPTRASHTGIIPLPEDLKGKAIIHWACDCCELDGHYCGSYALTHAVEINKRLKLIESNKSPAELVKNVIDQQKIPLDKSSLTWTDNIIKVADALSLNHVFLEVNGFGAFSKLGIGARDDLRRMAETRELLNSMKESILKNTREKQAHHFFVTFDVHVALISIIRDEDEYAMEICDNLNNPLKPNTKLHKYVSEIYNLYFPTIDQLYLKLFTMLEPTNPQKYLAKPDRKQMTKYLIDKWLLLRKEEISKDQWNAKKLNDLIKLLKEVHHAGAHDEVKESIIAVYDCMLDLAEFCSSKAAKEKYVFADKIVSAIKESAKAKFFNLDNDNSAYELLEKAQRVRNKLYSMGT